MIKVPCKGRTCKALVVWATDEKGTPQILDARAPVYELMGEDDHGKPLVRRHKQAFVSHFATCRDVAQFSGSKKR